jgi:serine/threonine protein phosphatase PrpC
VSLSPLRVDEDLKAPMKLTISAATDLGLRREHNEDTLVTWLPDRPEERARSGSLLVVADGMGGSKAGEVASRLAADTLVAAYREAPGDHPLERIAQALQTANATVHHESLSRHELHGMGTTCTAVVVRGSDLHIAHVGDSRASLVRDGHIRQLTHDHSLVAQLVAERHITAEQARVDPRRNVVTRSVGVGPTVEVDAFSLTDEFHPGDTLLISTDGLHGVVGDAELMRAASQPSLEKACDELVALARARGGPDNITVILARHERAASDPA